MRSIFLPLAGLALAGCGGGGGGGADGPAYCDSMNAARSATSAQCNGCAIQDSTAVADGSLYSFANVDMMLANGAATISAKALNREIAAGTEAGAFVTTVTTGATSNSLSFRTLRQGTTQQTVTAPAIAFDFTRGGTDAMGYAHFTPSLPFDTLEVTLTVTGATDPSAMDLRVYELCADGGV